ncbi:endonuclease/exonuclease/phosphatase family protein [Roseomonas sp. BN140053]|uniref:endonuclease/exonuclease/phosphatase family protein n=1 Tax=Roseomonas sp. BN140053 TaxID=3391898 RepID=UPI0039ED7B52
MLRLLLALFLLALPARAEVIKLATWNMNWLTAKPPGHPDLPADVAGRSADDLARLRDYARRLAPDVLALQEVDGPEAAALILDPADWQVFFPAESDVQRVGIAVRRGLRAVQEPDLLGLDLRPGARRSLRRGVDVTLQAGTSRLRLLALHLVSGCRQEALSGSRECDGLGEQAGVVAGWIAQRREEGVPFVVLGDFNRRMDRRREPFLAVLTQQAPLLRATAGVSNPCWGGRPFIDHLLLGGAARGWLVPDSLRVLVYAEREPEWRARLSDHCPVSIRLDLP